MEPGEEQAGVEATEYAGAEYDESQVQYDEAGNPYYQPVWTTPTLSSHVPEP